MNKFTYDISPPTKTRSCYVRLLKNNKFFCRFYMSEFKTHNYAFMSYNLETDKKVLECLSIARDELLELGYLDE